MQEEKNTHHLSIYLIKDSFISAAQVIHTTSCKAPIGVAIPGHGKGQLFIKKSPEKPPKWADLFQAFVTPKSLAVPSVSAALLIKVNSRRYVLAFGQGGRFLIKENVFEERFGLLCALNIVDPKSLRCVDVQSLDVIQSHTRIQSGQGTTSDQFGLDVEQDMLKAVVGSPLDESLGTRMTGTDSLGVSVKLDVSDLPFLLDKYRKGFEADLNATDHQWVNNMSVTKDPAVIIDLEAMLEAKIANKQFDNIWLSMPEIIDWHTVKGFMYTRGQKALYPDINLQGFLASVGTDEPLSLDLLRRRQVYCADANHKKVYKHWSVFKCLYAEIDFAGRKYILNDGKWFSVNIDFVTRTNTDFAKIPHSKLQLPLYVGGDEGDYNSAVAAAKPQQYALLDDKKKIMHGGGHGQVEVCDLLSIDKELIHIKRYGKSNVLSHLFSQGFVSGQLIQLDSEFREKVRGQLAPPFRDLFQVDAKPTQDEFTVVYAVISDVSGDDLYLPFFSRVNLNNIRKTLRGFGYKVELLKVKVDDAHSKIVKLPPKGKAANG